MSETHLQFEKIVRARAEEPCIIEAENGRTLTYQQFFAAVQAMRQKLGKIGRESRESGESGEREAREEKETSHRILLTLPGGVVDSVIWLAALTGGHMLIPLAPDATSEERKRATNLYNPDVLIVEQQEEEQHFSHVADQITVLFYDECDSLIRDVIDNVPSPILPFQEGSVCLMTSGTTGEPKGVILRERQIAWTADHIRVSHQLTPADRGLTPLPFFHVNAPVVSLYTTLVTGSTLIIARKFSRTHFWEWVERYQATWVSLVPAIIEILLSTERPGFLPGSVRFFRTGSSSLAAATLNSFEEKFGIPLIETYGLTEAASEVVGNPLPPQKHKPGSVGIPMSVSLRICSPRTGDTNEELQDVAQGETGEVCISGPNVITSYYNNEDEASFQNGWFRTGDIGHIDEEGYLFLTGRSREVIIRGGENIAPREIEEVLQSHPDVETSAVVGRPSPIYGEEVVAFIVPGASWNDESQAQLYDYAAQKLTSHKVPVDFIVTDELPRNATGKVERRLLRKQLAQGTKQAAEQGADAQDKGEQ